MNKGKLTLSNGEVITAWQNPEGGLHIGTEDGPIVPDYGDLTFTPDPITDEREPTFKELWDALPIGAAVPGEDGDSGWIKVSEEKFTLLSGGGMLFPISNYAAYFDSPPTEGFDLTTRINVWGDE